MLCVAVPRHGLHADRQQSIDLTQLPAHQSTTSHDGHDSSHPAVEYSSKEVSPPALLLQQLRRAHNIFLLHHGTTLWALHHRHKRAKFCNIMTAFWSRFATNWDVLLHGSPAVDIYDGMKLAAGGELGMGVGEEDWGSGERLVLEDFVQKTDGLVDLMVSRFGEPSPTQDASTTASKQSAETSDTEPWIGSGGISNAADGIIFSGVGAITPRSLRDLSQWIESIYCYGDHAYGVGDNPTADRRKRRRKNPKTPASPDQPSDERSTSQPPTSGTSAPARHVDSPGIPPPIVTAVETSLNKASSAVESTGKAGVRKTEAGKPNQPLASLGDTEMWMKYLTLGYGSAWGAKRNPPGDQTGTQEISSTPPATKEAPMTYVEPRPDVDVATEKLKAQVRYENTGYFLIGLKGDMDEGSVDDSNDEGDWNNRTLLRTVHVELAKKDTPETPAGDEDETPFAESEPSVPSFSTPSFDNLSRLRPVVYVVSSRSGDVYALLTIVTSIDLLSTPSFSSTVQSHLPSLPFTATSTPTFPLSIDRLVTAPLLIESRHVSQRPLTYIQPFRQSRRETRLLSRFTT